MWLCHPSKAPEWINKDISIPKYNLYITSPSKYLIRFLTNYTWSNTRERFNCTWLYNLRRKNINDLIYKPQMFAPCIRNIYLSPSRLLDAYLLLKIVNKLHNMLTLFNNVHQWGSKFCCGYISKGRTNYGG